MVWFTNLEQVFHIPEKAPIMICQESALGRQRLGNFPDAPLVYYSEVMGTCSHYCRHVIHVDKFDFEDTVDFHGVPMTNKERTLYEMIRDDAEEGALLEGIDFYCMLYDINVLKEYCYKRGNLDKLEYWLNIIKTEVRW